jgi:NADPH2:quinone reductase
VWLRALRSLACVVTPSVNVDASWTRLTNRSVGGLRGARAAPCAPMHASLSAPGQRAVLHELGETPLDAVDRHLTLEPMPPPDVAALGPREVVVAVKSAAVGWVDLIMASGQYQHVPTLPYTPGLEYAGEVAAVGAEVQGLAEGDRVLVDGFTAGPRSLGDYQGAGGFATWAVVPEVAVRRIPGALSFDQAAGLLGSYETAIHCLVTRGRLQPGETVLIHGASGATGLAAVQVAKRLGATVIATGRSDEKLAVVKAQGADHVLNTKALDGAAGVRRFRDDVKALTGGEGVDVVYDGVGGEVSLESMRCVRFGARFLIVGWAGTPFVAAGKGGRGAPNANQLPTNLIMMKGLDVLGCPTVISTVRNPALRPPRQALLWQWLEAGQLVPHVSHVFPLSEVKDALRAKWRGDVIGGAVVRP